MAKQFKIRINEILQTVHVISNQKLPRINDCVHVTKHGELSPTVTVRLIADKTILFIQQSGSAVKVQLVNLKVSTQNTYVKTAAITINGFPTFKSLSVLLF